MTDLPPDAPPTPDENREALAGELSLRILPPQDEADARALAERDPEFAAQVSAWDERFAGFAAGIPEVQPSPAVWARIQSLIAEVANDNAKLKFWRNWAVGSTGLLAASLALVVYLAAQPDPVAPPTTIPVQPQGVTRVATVSAEGGPPVVMLAYDSATGRLFIAPTQQMAGAGEGVPHLWLVLPDDAGVRLIGAIDGTQASTVSLNTALSGIAGDAPAVAISIEPTGTTPASDTPGGPVVASGALQQL